MNDSTESGDVAELQPDSTPGQGQPAREFQTVNPATGEPGRSYPGHTPEDAHEIAVAARRAQREWRRRSFDDRSAVIRNAAKVLRDRRDEFAPLMTEEMGKTLDDGRAEIEKC